MDDGIQLPPLPPKPPVVDGDAAMLAYGRACYKAGLVIGERRAEQAKPAKPEVHRARLSLADDGDWSVGEDRRPGRINILIHWTDDGRAWIESERNRELAAKMWNTLSVFAFAEVGEVADALDGGVR